MLCRALLCCFSRSLLSAIVAYQQHHGHRLWSAGCVSDDQMQQHRSALHCVAILKLASVYNNVQHRHQAPVYSRCLVTCVQYLSFG